MWYLRCLALENSGVRRGRPLNIEKRRAIIRAALDLFMRSGFDGTPMRAVAQAAGVSEPLLYRYYRSKQELLDAVTTFTLAESDALLRALVDAASRASTLRTFLHQAARDLMVYFDELGAWCVLQGAAPVDDAARKRIAQNYESGFQLLAHAVAARGSLKDPYVAARVFVGAIVHDDLLRRSRLVPAPSVELRDIFLEQLVELLVNGDIGR